MILNDDFHRENLVIVIKANVHSSLIAYEKSRLRVKSYAYVYAYVWRQDPPVGAPDAHAWPGARLAYTASRSAEFLALYGTPSRWIFLFVQRQRSTVPPIPASAHRARTSRTTFLTSRNERLPGSGNPRLSRRAARRTRSNEGLMCNDDASRDEAHTELPGQHRQDVGLLFAVQPLAPFNKTVHRFR